VDFLVFCQHKNEISLFLLKKHVKKLKKAGFMHRRNERDIPS